MFIVLLLQEHFCYNVRCKHFEANDCRTKVKELEIELQQGINVPYEEKYPLKTLVKMVMIMKMYLLHLIHLEILVAMNPNRTLNDSSLLGALEIQKILKI